MSLPPELPETPQRGSLTPAPRPEPLTGACRPTPTPNTGRGPAPCKCSHPRAEHLQHGGICLHAACGCRRFR